MANYAITSYRGDMLDDILPPENMRNMLWEQVRNNQPTHTRNSEGIHPVFPRDQFTKYEDQVTDPLAFYTSSGQFNLENFNRTFREEQLKRINFYRNAEIQRLKQLQDIQPVSPPIFQLSVGEHLIKLKNAFFGIVRDLQTEPLNSDIFTKNNRLFYVGLFLVMIFIIYLIFNSLITTAGYGCT